MKILTFVLLILFFTSCGIDKESPVIIPSENNSGELDISFNSLGYVTYNNSAGGNNNDEIHDIAVDSQNRVIAVGSSLNGAANNDLVVYRLTPNGNLDTSFSGDGIFIHDNAAGGSGNDAGYAVVIGANDEIYIAGTSHNGSNFDLAVWKITNTGTLDTSFNGSGIFVHSNASGGNIHDQGSAISLDNAGRVVVAGFSDRGPTNRDMVVWRLTTSGVLDTAFDSDGIFIEDGTTGGTNEQAYGVVIDASNSIYIAGEAEASGESTNMALWKITSAGLADASFATGGVFTHHSAAGGLSSDAGQALILDSQGRIYVTGFSRNVTGNSDMALWRLTSAGVLDTTFDSDGYLTFDVGTVIGSNTNDTGESMLIDSEGRIVIVGNGNSDMVVWRFTANGELDTEFNNDGFFSHDSAAGGFDIDSARGVAEDSQDRLYIGGYSETLTGDHDSTIWRLY